MLGYKAVPDTESVVFCDTSDGMLDQVKQKIAYYHTQNATVLNADFTSGELPNKTFDLIMSMLVLHHVPNLGELVANFNKLLNPGGYFCWIDLEPEDGSFHGDTVSVAHLGFKREDTEALLVNNNFELVYYSDQFYMEKMSGGEDKKFKVFLLVGRKL